MYKTIFEDLGLSPNEAKIYEALVERGESSISDISVTAKIHRRNTYDAIERLISKGLAFQIFSTTENLYSAVDPDKLSEILAEKQQALSHVLPSLKKKFLAHHPKEEAFIYKGFEGQRNIWREMIRVGDDVLSIGAKGQWFDPKLDVPRNSFFSEVNRKKMKFSLLFDHEVLEQIPDFPSQFPAPLQHRFLPKEYSTNSTENIFGDYIVTYTGVSIKKTEEDIVFFVIHSKDLAESHRRWFWYMWEQSSKNKKK